MHHMQKTGSFKKYFELSTNLALFKKKKKAPFPPASERGLCSFDTSGDESFSHDYFLTMSSSIFMMILNKSIHTNYTNCLYNIEFLIL